MFKNVLLGTTLVLGFAFAPQITAPAHAEGIYCGGSHTPGIVPWRGQPGIGPYGVSPGCGGGGYGHQRRGPVYYNGYRGGQTSGRQMQTNSWSRTTIRRATARSVQPVAPVAVRPVLTSAPSVIAQTVQHPFADVPKSQQYRCAPDSSGVLVAATPGTGWCHD